MSAALGAKVLLIPVINQGVEAVDRLHINIASPTTIPTVRTSEGDEFFTAERDAAVAAMA